MNIWTVWLKLKKKRARFCRHRPICSQNQCEDKDVLVLVGHSSSSLCIVEMNEQYRSTTSLKNLDLAGDADKKYEAYYDPQTQRSYESEQDDAPLDDSLSTVKMSELSNSSTLHLIHEALEYERLVRTRTLDILDWNSNRS